MVEQQIRPWEVLDENVLRLFEQVPREDYVPVKYRKLAFADLPIPLAHDQFMMKPVVEGRMLQALKLQPEESVLEIGTGSGYITTCLSRLAKSVCSVELFEDIFQEAKQRLQENNATNVDCFLGNALTDWLPELAHDVIVVTGSVSVLPERFKEWVNPGGRLFAITGESPLMDACLFTRLGISEWAEESLFETDINALVNSEQAPAFDF